MEPEHWVRVAEGSYGGGAGYASLSVEKHSGKLRVTASPLGVEGFQTFSKEHGDQALQLYSTWSYKVSDWHKRPPDGEAPVV